MVVKSESRASTPISLVIIHTNEGDHKPNMPDDHTAEDLAAYLDRANTAQDWKSYHLICDDNSTVRYVPDDQAAWSALAANRRSLNLCFTGWAHWSRDEWMAHESMLRRGAAEVARWCATYHLPSIKLTPAQVGADQHGVCGHGDWSTGKNNGNHTDPGAAFPWATFMAMVTGAPAPPTPPSPPPGANPEAIPTMHLGERSENVLRLQRFMTSHFQSYNDYYPTGYYGSVTKAGIAEFQRRTGITGPDADGSIVGPRTKVQLAKHGLVW